MLAFYDDYGRGMDGMQLPYVTRCFRAVVVDQDAAGRSPHADAGPGDDADADDPEAGARRPTRRRPSGRTDTDMLLIDFR